MRSRYLLRNLHAPLVKKYHPRPSSLRSPSRILGFHTSRPLAAVRPFLLSDPGEGNLPIRFCFYISWDIVLTLRIGIKEVQIIQWFVQPGARVEQFDKVCEVASDKANIEVQPYFTPIYDSWSRLGAKMLKRGNGRSRRGLMG